METIMITGGSGMIGKALTKALLQKGYSVIILTRSDPKWQDKQLSYANWDPQADRIDQDAFSRADHIIHLAGANVGKGRWTKKRKREIVESRTKSGTVLANSLERLPNRVRTVVSASATGWYGPDQPGNTPFKEEDPPASDFLGTTCQQWEGSIIPVRASGKRLVILRTGIALSREGGAYPEFKKSLAFGIASILGNGKQNVSWIHIDDLVNMYIHAIENNSVSGVYNAVAPQPVSNRELVLTIAKERNHLYLPVPVPAVALKTLLGEMSIEVLKSVTVSSEKIRATGFTFRYPTIEEAVKELETTPVKRQT